MIGDQSEEPAMLLDEELGLSPPHNSLRRSIQFAAEDTKIESSESYVPLESKDACGAAIDMHAKKLAG